MSIKTFGPPLAGILAETPKQATTNLVLVGLPDDTQSSYRRGPASAPEWIRRAYDGACYNASTEMGVDLSGIAADLGDWSPGATWQLTDLQHGVGDISFRLAWRRGFSHRVAPGFKIQFRWLLGDFNFLRLGDGVVRPAAQQHG